MNFDIYVQISSLISIGVSLYLLHKWSVHDTTRLLWTIPIASWLAHELLYYSVIAYRVTVLGLFGTYPLLTTWSAVLRLHCNITVLMIILTLVKLNGKVDKHG